MTSSNNQYIQFEDKVVKRYTKTIPGMLTGRRLDPHRPENTIDWLLHTPETNFRFITNQETRKTELIRQSFDYGAEVIELYSDIEVRLFERLNKSAIESGMLVVYNDTAPELDTSNMLTDNEVAEIASIKQLLALKKRLSQLTSVHSLNRIARAAEELDRPVSVIKAIKERIDDVSTNNK